MVEEDGHKTPDIEDGEGSRNHPDLEKPDSNDKSKEGGRTFGNALPTQDPADGMMMMMILGIIFV